MKNMKKKKRLKKKLENLLKKRPRKQKERPKRIEKRKEDKPKPKFEKKSGVIESYQLNVDKAKVDINIEKKEGGVFYNLSIPEIDIGTAALLQETEQMQYYTQ